LNVDDLHCDLLLYHMLYVLSVVTLLDCVYYEEMLTYFILDAIMWGDHDLKELPVCI